jgi:hypothetical protein
MKVIAIYPGRFQPWHLGHKSVYDALVRQFGVENVYIATSDKVDPPRSPFNFAEKQQIIAATGVDRNRVVQTRDPYKAIEITSQYDPQDTKLLFAVSAKDMADDPRFKSWSRRDGSPAYFQPAPNKVSEMADFDQHGYIFVVPTLDFKVDGRPMRSATEFRREFAAADAATKAKMTQGILGTNDPSLVKLLASRITEGNIMKLNDVVNETTAGAIGSVVAPLGATQRRKVKEVDSKKQLTPGDVLDHARRAREHTGQKPIKEATGTGQPLSVEQLATISDEALDHAYHYGRSSPGNTFGWQANLKSAAFAKKIIDAGVTDIEKISDAIHRGWNVTAQAFVKDPMQFDDSKTMAPEKLQAKLAQREKLMTQQYAQLPEDEKEKDRVVARAMLQAITGDKPSVTESSQRVDRLVTRSLKIMRGATTADAVAALKTVLGEMEYNERPQFYDFFIKQMVDMYGQQGVAEGTADDINKMFGNAYSPEHAALQRVALLAMQGRQQEASGRLQSVIKDASPKVQQKIIDAVNNIKPVTVNGKIADSSALDKSKSHQDWISNTFIPWVESLLGQQGVAEGGEKDRQWSNKDMERLRRAETELDDIFGTPNDTWTKTKQSQIKNRIQTKPMAGPRGTLPEQGVAEGWSQKYKNSINCKHPRGFSQKAHCAGKRKQTESTVMEMTCPDCGMCKSHGTLSEIRKGQKDANGYTKCWPGKHAEGTKTGKNGGQVRNCEPNESVTEGELNTGRMNKQHQDFYEKNPSFKDTDKEVVSFGDRKLATRVSPTGGVTKVKKKPITPFESHDFHDSVTFEIDNENAFNHVMGRFNSRIGWDGEYMVAPRRYWGAIQELAHEAGGAATEISDEHSMAEDMRTKADFRREIDDTVADFLSRGGEIETVPPNRVRVKPGQSLASKHIGSKRETGRIVGKGRQVHGNKPVVNVSEVNDYFKRRKDEEDRIAGTKSPAKRTPQQTDYQKRRDKEQQVGEAKQKPSAQERFNNRLKTKHGIDLDAMERQWAERTKKIEAEIAALREKEKQVSEGYYRG